MKKYLLPCNCGQNVEVEANQAGLPVTCACGATLEVPTLRGLSQLRLAEAPAHEKSAAAESTWGPGQGVMFLGTIIGLCGLIALMLVLRTRPEWVVQTEQITVNVDRLSAEQLWTHWQDLRKGLNPGDDPVRQRFEAEWSEYRRHRTMALIPLVLGAVMLVGGFALTRASGPRRERSG